MMCQFKKPFITHNKIIVFAPPLAQSEFGFEYWVEKVLKLGQELTISVTFVCDKRTEEATKIFLEEIKNSVPVNYKIYDDWDHMQGLKSFREDNAFLFYVSSRYGEVSYRDSLDGLAKKLERIHQNENVVLVFPSRVDNQHIDEYEDVQAAPIFRKISKEIGNMFNKDK